MLAAALSILAGGTVGLEQPSAYPLEPIWKAFMSYCTDRDATVEGWESMQPEPSTTVDRLSVNRVVPRALPEKFPVTLRVVAGREVYGIKREWANPSMGKRYFACEVYDLNLRSDVDLSPLAAWSGSDPEVENREHERTLTWESRLAPSQDGVRVTLQLPGRFPIPDEVGFVGLRLSTRSSESL